MLKGQSNKIFDLLGPQINSASNSNFKFEKRTPRVSDSRKSTKLLNLKLKKNAKCTISLHPTVENLNCKNPFKHHKISFSRPIQSPNGGLCGLASLYQALENTVYTPSELTEFSYPGMRAAITSEIGSNSTATAGLTDSALLDAYYSCK